jgi:soluble lytic murein transglycosylase-like protein
LVPQHLGRGDIGPGVLNSSRRRGRSETIRASRPIFDGFAARARATVGLSLAAALALGAANGAGAPSNPPKPPTKPANTEHKAGAAGADSKKGGVAADAKHSPAASQAARKDAPRGIPLPRERPAAADAPPVPPELVAFKQAVDLLRQHRLSDAAASASSTNDPVVRKLIEWLVLRSPDSDASLERYVGFIHANPDWPSIPLLRRRAEERLWQRRRDAATVRSVIDGEPRSALGRLALARVLMAEGDRAGAEREVRAVWQAAPLSAEVEAATYDSFREMLTRADHVARMDRRIGAKDFGAAMRAAKRLGDPEVAIVQACAAGEAKSKDTKSKDAKSKGAKSKDAKSKDAKSKGAKSKDAKSKDAKSNDTKSKDTKSSDTKSKDAKPKDTKPNAARPTDAKSKAPTSKDPKSHEAKAHETKAHETKLNETKSSEVKSSEAKSSTSAAPLDVLASNTRRDLGYTLCRLHALAQRNEVAAAARLVLEAPREDMALQDTDEWWRERRLLARRLLDLGDPATAYRVASEAAPPANPYYRAEYHFLAGWIALRFIDDPTTARAHFALIDQGSADPIVLARAGYWRGRAAEALGLGGEMRAQYEAAAGFPTAYYGQLARARLGLDEIAAVRAPPQTVPSEAAELVRAAEMLYAIGERDLVGSFVSDLAEQSNNAAVLAALGRLTAARNDARAMLLLGKTALARGLALDHYAFPDIGVPAYNAVGPRLDRSIVYSIVRTESAFDQRDMSPAKAVGLMQVTPEAGKDTAKRFGVSYDWNRLVSDPVYNTQMGVAELAALLAEYRGSYIMTFAGYNAGRGRVRQWVGQHGDPRDPRVDAVDWVERIPISETRNYVQRVMENLQVYRVRFGANLATIEPNLHRTATVQSPFEPASVQVAPR